MKNLETWQELFFGQPASAADQKPLLSRVVFNFLVGNADAHAKNLAVIFTPKGPRLAPFYDLICTRVYPGLADRLAMRIGGENRPEWIQPRHWERFSSEISIKFRLTLRTLKEMAQKITSNAGVLVRDFGSGEGDVDGGERRGGRCSDRERRGGRCSDISVDKKWSRN